MKGRKFLTRRSRRVVSSEPLYLSIDLCANSRHFEVTPEELKKDLLTEIWDRDTDRRLKRHLSSPFVAKANCYFVIINRDPCLNIDYGIDDVFTIINEGYKHELVPMFGGEGKHVLPDVVRDEELGGKGSGRKAVEYHKPFENSRNA
jgi:hypothetical protein